MPTIKDLPLALAAADNDLLPVSQGGFSRRVSRAQLLAGMQPALALPSGALLGRSSDADAQRRAALAINPHSFDRNPGMVWLEH